MEVQRVTLKNESLLLKKKSEKENYDRIEDSLASFKAVVPKLSHALRLSRDFLFIYF
jgi:hypothetical protein